MHAPKPSPSYGRGCLSPLFVLRDAFWTKKFQFIPLKNIPIKDLFPSFCFRNNPVREVRARDSAWLKAEREFEPRFPLGPIQHHTEPGLPYNPSPLGVSNSASAPITRTTETQSLSREVPCSASVRIPALSASKQQARPQSRNWRQETEKVISFKGKCPEPSTFSPPRLRSTLADLQRYKYCTSRSWCEWRVKCSILSCYC